MNKLNSWLVVGVLFVIGLASISAEIHRARNTPTYQYRIKKPYVNQNNRKDDPEIEKVNPESGKVDSESVKVDVADDSWTVWWDSKAWGHPRKVWILSAIASALVGLTGIIPLLIIPADCGFSLKSEASSTRMKCLLSFAVGGLLGDVFLHLLPEAWSHVDDYENRLEGYRAIGMWFLGGLLSFYFVEKMVGGEDDNEDDEEDVAVEEMVRGEEEKGCVDESSDNEDKMMFAKLIMRERKDEANYLLDKPPHPEFNRSPSHETNFTAVRNRKVTRNNDNDEPDLKIGGADDDDYRKITSVKGNSSKAAISNGTLNTVIKSNGKGVVNEEEEEDDDVLGEEVVPTTKPEKIKVSGWLNLVANIVDNFTHGLAVAGSFCISPKMGCLTTFAILLHEIPHEIGDFAILLKAGFNRWKAAKAQLMTATGGLIGAMIALSAESVKSAGDSTAWILPFTAGGFVNIALVTIVPDLVKEKKTRQSLKQFGLVTSGILVMALVTALVE